MSPSVCQTLKRPWPFKKLLFKFFAGLTEAQGQEAPHLSIQTTPQVEPQWYVLSII